MEAKSPIQILRQYYLVNSWGLGICGTCCAGFAIFALRGGGYGVGAFFIAATLLSAGYLFWHLPKAKRDLQDGIQTESCLVLQVRYRRRGRDRWTVRTAAGPITLENHTAIDGSSYVTTTVDLTYSQRTKLLLAVDGKFMEPEDDEMDLEDSVL